jgi:AcrR family transcriptional regulator
MRKPRKDAQETRQRLLAAAAEVFAAKGFREATHAEICRKAGANTAAINYHFGSKEELYVAAWKHAFEESLKAHPPDGGVGPGMPASERLRGRILSFMDRIADPNNHEVEIMHREMANPTGLLARVLPRALEPMQQDARAIIRELLGAGATEQKVSFCVMSLMGQCFAPMLHLRHARRNRDAPRPPGPPLEFRVEELADHVTRFSLAGIRGIRAEAGGGRKVVRKPRRNKKTSKQE